MAGAVGIPVDRCSGSELAMRLVAPISYIFFPFLFSSIIYFSHRSVRIKKVILQKLTGTHKNLGVDNFPDPVGHFRAPLAAILDFAGSAALHAVSERPLRR